MISQTKPRKEFKSLFGQANHFVITALVGLHYLEKGDVKTAPLELHASWSPKDPKQSAIRSRSFILNSVLSSAVDALDVYLTLLWREPKWIDGDDVENVYSKAGRSVHAKALGLSHLLNTPAVERAMIEVIITWRNNVAHELAENQLSDASQTILEKEKDQIQDKYCGLDASSLAKKANNGNEFTFKEAASLIHATQDFVETLDSIVLKRLRINEFSMKYFEDRLAQLPNLKRDFYGFTEHRARNLVLNVLEGGLGIPKSDHNDSDLLTNIMNLRGKRRA